MKYRIALAGVPNCGKTTLWNLTTGKRGKIGNWPGVTTEKLSAPIKYLPDTELIDIPGMYSLHTQSLEETAAKNYLISEKIDSLIIIIDGTKPEQGLYFAMDLLSLNIPSVIGINFSDEMENQGITVDTESLSRSLGIPFFLISAKKNKNTQELLHFAKKLCSAKNKPFAFLSPPDRRKKAAELSEKYFLKKRTCKSAPFISLTLSSLLITVLVFLFAFLSPMLKSSISVFFEFITYAFCAVLSHYHVPEIFNSFLAEGLFPGIESLALFIPELFLIFAVLAFLEESGFMAECAFVSDPVLKKLGLTGRSIIPLVLGFGCTVSGICAAKSSDCAECSKQTLSALMFIPCSARLPLVILLCNSLSPKSGFLFLLVLYLSVILLGAAYHMLGKNKADCGFVLELPSFRTPSFFVLIKTSFRRLFSFIIKAGGAIVLTSVLIWFLKNFSPDFRMVQLQSESILYRLGQILVPVFSPVGINFDGAVALFCGLFSKESALSALASLSPDLSAFSGISGISFLLFYLIYSPCFASVAAIKKEYGAKKAFSLFLRQIILAYLVSLVFYQSALFITNLFIP